MGIFGRIDTFITWFDGVVWGLPFPPVVASFALMICLVFLHLQRFLDGIITENDAWNICLIRI